MASRVCSELIDGVVVARGWATEFSRELLAEAEVAAKNPPLQNDANREDFRNLELLTIDGADARDFDDAICCASSGGGFCLRVAVADVGAFVAAGSALDAEARRRGTSVYLPDRVLPMLPPALSNDACSLNPAQDKLCMLCEMHIENGEIQNYRFARGVMRSRRRLTYEEAFAKMENGKDENLRAVAALSAELKQARLARGAFMMETPEKRITVSPAGMPVAEEVRRNGAHIAVEECMIAANRCAADFVIRRRLPALHRIHKKPDEDGVRNLRITLRGLGVDFPARPEAADFSAAHQAVLAQDAALGECLLPVLLGALARAAYAPDEETGHFGLACPHYLHFTSPIRRYPDLLAHRAIAAGLGGEKVLDEDLEEIGAHCSQTEISADKGGWDCRQRLLCLLAQDKVGAEYEVMVSGVAPFGLFVAAGELGLDGLVRFSDLPGYWRYDAGLRRAVNSNGGQILELGGRLRAKLAAVSPQKGRADFVPL